MHVDDFDQRSENINVISALLRLLSGRHRPLFDWMSGYFDGDESCQSCSEIAVRLETFLADQLARDWTDSL